MDKMELFDILTKEIEKAEIENVEYVKGNYGKANRKTKTIRIPHPKTLITLATGLHEVAHIHVGNVKPQYYQEFLCEMWVQEKFKEYGIEVPWKVECNQKNYVAYRVRVSLRRRKKNFEVHPAVKEFCGDLIDKY